MSDRSEALTLLGEIRKSRVVLIRINGFYDARFQPPSRGDETSDTAIILAEILGNYYTAVETIFLRLSQFFENALSTERWHRDLLNKMTLDIPSIRPRIISDETQADLDDLLAERNAVAVGAAQGCRSCRPSDGGYATGIAGCARSRGCRRR